MAEVVNLSWDDCDEMIGKIVDWLSAFGKSYDSVHGVPRGGLYPAVKIAGVLGLPLVSEVGPRTLVVDDVVDSGATSTRYPTDFVALVLKPGAVTGGNFCASGALLDGWVTFPWEAEDSGPEDAVRRILQYIGEDPDREGLIETPKRVLKAYRELVHGYDVDPAVLLSKVFNETSDQMVVSSNIEFVSLCEHHMLPFIGVATVGYLPDGKVVGLSKLARTVDAYARRLQVQERLTDQIADALVDNLQPLGCGVIIQSSHQCQSIRGAMKRDAMMTTSALRGKFLDDPVVRSEFLSLR